LKKRGREVEEKEKVLGLRLRGKFKERRKGSLKALGRDVLRQRGRR
jgi:hypothetical protein